MAASRFRHINIKETMNTRIEIKSAVLGAFLGAAVVFSVAATTGGAAHTVWEHKIVTQQSGLPLLAGLEQPLDAAAKDGWEAVGLGDNMGASFVLMRRPKK